MRKEEITVIVFCVRASISAQMGGIGSVILTRTEVAGYKTVINVLKKEAFGRQCIDKVRLSDAKEWLIKLQQVDGRGYSSIHSIRGVLRPAFQMICQWLPFIEPLTLPTYLPILQGQI